MSFSTVIITYEVGLTLQKTRLIFFRCYRSVIQGGTMESLKNSGKLSFGSSSKAGKLSNTKQAC